MRMHGQVQARRAEGSPETDVFPDLPDDLEPAGAPLRELGKYDYFLPDEDDDLFASASPPNTPSPIAPSPLAPSPPVQITPPPVVQDTRPPARVARHDPVLAGPALVLVLAFFGCGGVALIATGLLLGGVAGAALAVIGGLIALTVGVATRSALAAESLRAR